jgi:streptogramin lyase
VVGGDPVRLLATDDAIWATVGGPGTLVRIDPTTDRVIGSVAVGRLPAGLAWFAGAIWVAEGESKSVVRVDPATMAVHGGVNLDVAPWSMATTSDAVWVTDRYAEQLIRIDTGSMTAGSIDVPGVIPMNSWDYGDGVVAVGDRLWVASGEGVALYDPATASFRTSPAPLYPHLAVTQDAVWLVSKSSRILQRLDPETLEPLAQQAVDVSPVTSAAEWEVSIAATDDAIWLQSYEDGLIRVQRDAPAGSGTPSGP